VVLDVSVARLIGDSGARAVCQTCGEEILNGRELWRAGRTLCIPCAGESYYSSGKT
jgi:formylmethanofuran dehydrogenase subunit E